MAYLGYLMPNPAYNIIYMIFQHILWITFLNKSELFFAHSEIVSSIAI